MDDSNFFDSQEYGLYLAILRGPAWAAKLGYGACDGLARVVAGLSEEEKALLLETKGFSLNKREKY